MATHRIPILGFATVPDNTGECYQHPYSEGAGVVNAIGDPMPFWFENTANRHGFGGVFSVPQNYSSAANLIVIWTCNPTSGSVEWDFDYIAVGGNDTEDLDGTLDESVNAADVAPSAAHERLEISISLTDGNFAAGDTVLFLFARDGTDAGDTLAGDAFLFGLEFEYSD